MIQVKICLLGSFCVGKTSLVRRYVRSEFSARYLTTLGVRVDRKNFAVGDKELAMLLWDIHGEDRFQSIRPNFIRGASGYVLVVDGTRQETFNEAIHVKNEADAILGDVPMIALINKNDLVQQWQITPDNVDELGDCVFQTSAKTGENVAEAFEHLAKAICCQQSGA